MSMFSSKKTFMSVIHFELIFVYGVKVEVQLPSFTCGYPFVLSSFVEDTIFFSIRCCCCSVAKLCLTLCDPMGCSVPGFAILHHLPEFAQTHVH